MNLEDKCINWQEATTVLIWIISDLVKFYITNITPCQVEWKEGQRNTPCGTISSKQSSKNAATLFEGSTDLSQHYCFNI